MNESISSGTASGSSKKISIKDKIDSRPGVSAENTRSLWLRPLVIALFIAFLFLVTDLAVFSFSSHRAGEIASSDVYAPSSITLKIEHLNIKYLAGEIIIRRGEKVTPQIAAALDLILSSSRVSWLPRVIGYLLIFLVLGHLIHKYFKVLKLKWLNQHRSLNLFLLTIMLTVASMKLVSILGGSVKGFILLNPVPVASLLLALLLGLEAAVIATIVLAPLFGIIVAGGGQSMAVAYALLGSFGASLMVGPQFSARKDVFKATLLLSAVNSAMLISFVLLDYLPGSKVILVESGSLIICSFLNGILVFLFVTGFVPLFEKSFEVITVSTLQQLADSSQPLMRRLVNEAPGTYHHCVNVANLGAAAAKAIDASCDLVRAGAMYHDIGKLKRPLFFSENQHGGVNCHDSISPHLSRLIITAHRKDGLELAEKEGLPDSICQIIAQHHGTDLVSYFYHGAKKIEKEKEKENRATAEVQARSFRYLGPKPQSREAAIVMICDSSEAAVRSLSNPTSGSINKLVTKIINDKFIDGQFDECHLNKKEIHLISESLTSSLAGIYHSRIAYPDEKELVSV